MTRRAIPLIVALLFAAGCGGGDPVDVDGDDGTPASGAGGTLVAAISAQPDRLDPHTTTAYPSFQVLENVYDTLVVPNPEDNLEYEPALATEWTVSDDQLTWTFQLREGVTFHDGSQFDAADVVYSLDRIIDDELANAYRFGTVRRVRADGDMAVEIVLREPTPNLLANLGAFKGMAILPEGAADDLDLDTEAVGTGPFELQAMNPGSVTLAAYGDYWGEGPFVDEVEMRFVSEATTALTGLRAGEVHWTDNVPPQQLESLEGEDALTVETVPSVDYWYLSMNFEREPFDDPRVREAIAWGIDREAVTEAAHFEGATVNQTAIPEGSEFYSDYAPYSHDPERARELLDEAGADDLRMGLMVTDEFPETVQAAQVLESQLGEIGIEVRIQTEDFATWLDRQGQGDFDAFMLGWLGNADPFDYYHSQHVCDGSNNYQGYCNEDVTRLLEEAATETDQEARKALYDEAVQGIVDDNSYIYLYNPDVVQAWTEEVSEFQIRADRAINFETVRLEG